MKISLKLVVLNAAFGIIIAFFIISSQGSVQAQGVGQGQGQGGVVGASLAAPAVGTDMWTGVMGQQEYFLPHPDNCDFATEAFIQILPTGEGYCMERDQRPSEHWERARHTCLQEGKRLPEVAEFQFACDDAATYGLNGMTNDLEWASNFSVITGSSSSSFMYVPVAGRSQISHCDGVGQKRIGSTSQQIAATSQPFRCVH